jgi:hypothetical protein
MRQVGLFLLSWWMASMTVLVLPEGRGRGREREREREGDREREDEARLGRVVVLEIF